MTGMFTWEYVVSGDQAAAHTAVRDALAAQEFTVEEQSADEWRATQGTRPSFLERLTSYAHEPIVLTVKFAPGPEGLVVTLHRPAFGASGMTRNAVQMSYLDKAYRAAAAGVHEKLAGAGILVSARE